MDEKRCAELARVGSQVSELLEPLKTHFALVMVPHESLEARDPFVCVKVPEGKNGRVHAVDLLSIGLEMELPWTQDKPTKDGIYVAALADTTGTAYGLYVAEVYVRPDNSGLCVYLAGNDGDENDVVWWYGPIGKMPKPPKVPT